jgi:copper resistance protein D
MDSSLDTLIAGARAIHFGAAIVLFGQFAFLLVVAPGRQAPPHFLRTSAWSIGVVAASAIAWLALEALTMSGLPAGEALSMQTLTVVATQTQFGRVWLARLLITAALVAVIASLRSDEKRTGLQALGGALAMLLVASVAGMGHAAAGQGGERLLHVGADAAHLLAGGLWLGALVPLISVLERARRARDKGELLFAASATQRFSGLGVAAMSILLASGIANGCYMLSSLAALANSEYGHMVLAKIVLFVIIIGIAAINRQRLTPLLLAARDGSEAAVALRSLGRNAIVECLLGFGIIAIVGKLGITIPGPHMH